MLRPVYPEQRFIVGDYFVPVWVSLMVVMPLAPAYFMNQIRRNPALGAGAAKPL